MLTEASRAANFTNETGVDGTDPLPAQHDGPVAAAGVASGPGPARGRRADLASCWPRPRGAAAAPRVIDPDDPAFLAPGDMPARIAGACRRTGQRPPAGPAADRPLHPGQPGAGLPARGRRGRRSWPGGTSTSIHLVGGGARNELLCQLTADACGLPVVAGPVEATALGNVLVQARALGAAPGDLAGMRALIRAHPAAAAVRARQRQPPWHAAARRIGLEPGSPGSGT